MNISQIREILSHLSFGILDNTSFVFLLNYDKKFTTPAGAGPNIKHGRLYLQVVYKAPCTKTGQHQEWKGRKWYLSYHMIENEIIGTAWAAIKAVIEHEMMEGFKYDNTIIFNPHTDFQQLIQLSKTTEEVKRT